MDTMSPIQSTSEIKFNDRWRSITVDEGVTEGRKQRNLKPRPVSAGNGYYRKNNTRRKLLLKSPGQGCAKFSKRIHYKNPFCKKKKKAECTLRIAELAIPTKRHCFNSWQNNYHVLPAVMIERLQQMINDLKPMIHIKDAYGCFTQKPRKKKRSKQVNHFYRKGQKLKESNTANNIRNNHQCLCTRFASAICKLLFYPKNNIDCSGLSNYYAVISKDVSNLMGYKRKKRNAKIHEEMIRKITIWMIVILEETKEILLMEQLQELEELEGPALDFIDLLVKNVLDICAPMPKEPFNIMKFLQETQSRSSESINTQEYFVKEINTVIKNVLGIDEHSNDDNSNIEESKVSPDDRQLTTITKTNVSKPDIQYGITSPISDDESNEINKESPDVDEGLAQGIEEQTQGENEEPNVSAIQIPIKDDEDNNINDNLSIIKSRDGVNVTEMENKIMKKPISSQNLHSGLQSKQLVWADGTEIEQKPALNDNQRYSLNESWPNHLPSNSHMITTSNSLGIIKETDENKVNSFDLTNKHQTSGLFPQQTMVIKSDDINSMAAENTDTTHESHASKTNDELIGMNIYKDEILKPEDITTQSNINITQQQGNSKTEEMKTTNNPLNEQISRIVDYFPESLDKITEQNMKNPVSRPDDPGETIKPVQDGSEPEAITKIQKKNNFEINKIDDENLHKILEKERETYSQDYASKVLSGGKMATVIIKDYAGKVMSGGIKGTVNGKDYVGGELTDGIRGTDKRKDYAGKDGKKGTVSRKDYAGQVLSSGIEGTVSSKDNADQVLSNGIKGTVKITLQKGDLNFAKTSDENERSKYVVNLDTAPSWVTHQKKEDPLRIKQEEARAWFEDLQYVLDKLEHVNTWITNTSKDVLLTMQKKGRKKCCSNYNDTATNEMFQSINKTAIIYSKINKDLRWILQNHKEMYQNRMKNREKQIRKHKIKRCCCSKKYLRST